VEFKPKPGEKAANGANAAQTPAQEEAELKEAASF